MFRKKTAQEKNISASSVKGLTFRGGKALFVRHIMGFAVNFSCGVVLARTLGPEVMGLYFISYTVFVILRQLTDFGTSVHLIRIPSAPSDYELRRAYTLQQAIALLGAAAAFFVIAPLSVRLYGHAGLYPLICSAAAGAYFSSWQSVPFSQMERNLEYGKVGLVEVAEIVAFNLAAVGFVYAGYGYWGLVLGNVLRGFVPAFLCAAMTRMRPAFILSRGAISDLARTTWPIFGANLVVWIILLAPPLLVGTLAGTKELGIAQLAYSLLGNTMFVSAIFQRLSLTSLSKFQDDMERFNSIVQNALKLLFVMYLPLTMGIASLSPLWVPFLYGPEWAGMSGVMLVAALPFTSAALLSVLLSALLSKGYAPLVFRQNAVHAVIYWAVMAAIASYAGALSVPIAHLIAMSAGYMFVTGYSRHCGTINYRPLAFGFVAGAATMAAAWHLAGRGAVVAPLALWAAFIGGYILISASARQTMIFFFKNLKET